MRLLFDTRAWVWWLADEPCLSDEARRAIAAAANDVFVSVATIWELSLKTPRYVKIALPGVRRLEEWVEQDGFHLLPIEGSHIARVVGRDVGRNLALPILIGQASTRGMAVITHNPQPFRSAGIDVVCAEQFLFRVRGRSGGRGERSRSSRPTE